MWRYDGGDDDSWQSCHDGMNGISDDNDDGQVGGGTSNNDDDVGTGPIDLRSTLVLVTATAPTSNADVAEASIARMMTTNTTVVADVVAAVILLSSTTIPNNFFCVCGRFC